MEKIDIDILEKITELLKLTNDEMQLSDFIKTVNRIIKLTMDSVNSKEHYDPIIFKHLILVISIQNLVSDVVMDVTSRDIFNKIKLTSKK